MEDEGDGKEKISIQIIFAQALEQLSLFLLKIS